MKSIDLEPRLKDLKWLLAIVLLIGGFAHMQSNASSDTSLPQIPESHTLHIDTSSDPELAFSLSLFEESDRLLTETEIEPITLTLSDFDALITQVEESMQARGMITSKVSPRTLSTLTLVQSMMGKAGTVDCNKDVRLTDQFTLKLTNAHQIGQAIFVVAHETVHLAMQRCWNGTYTPAMLRIFEADAQAEAREALSHMYFTSFSPRLRSLARLGILYGNMDVSSMKLQHDIMSTDYCASHTSRKNVQILGGGDSCEALLVDALLREHTMEVSTKYGVLPARFLYAEDSTESPVGGMRLFFYLNGLTTYTSVSQEYLARFIREEIPLVHKE